MLFGMPFGYYFTGVQALSWFNLIINVHLQRPHNNTTNTMNAPHAPPKLQTNHPTPPPEPLPLPIFLGDWSHKF
jgi:hypothetical protein